MIKISEMDPVIGNQGDEFGQVVQEGENRRAELLFIDANGTVPYVDTEIIRVEDLIPDINGLATEDYVNTSTAQTLVSANEYTDTAVADVSDQIPDITGLATESYADAGDATTLTSANTYTDDAISGIGGIEEAPPGDGYYLRNNGNWVAYTDYMPFRSSARSTPITVTENTIDLEVLEITTDELPVGDYLIGVGLVGQFSGASDRLYWNVTGDFPSPIFIDESKDSQENLPHDFNFPISWGGGSISLQLICNVDGPGSSDVVVSNANFLIKRVG